MKSEAELSVLEEWEAEHLEHEKLQAANKDAMKPRLITTPELEKLAAEANRCHYEIGELIRTTIQTAKRAGDALRDARKIVPFGQWETWVKKNFDGSLETARVYMKVSEHWDGRLKAALENNPKLTIEDARQILKRPPIRTDNGAEATDFDSPAVIRRQLFENAKRIIEITPDEVLPELRHVWYELWHGGLKDFPQGIYGVLRKRLGIPDYDPRDCGAPVGFVED